MKFVCGMKNSVAMLLFSSMPLIACAEDATWFVGLGLGAGTSDEKVEMANGMNSFETASITKLFGGYWISPHIGVEAAYNYFGNFDSNDSVIQHTLDIDSFSMGLIGRLPLSEQFSIMAKAGAMRWATEEEYTGAENDGTTAFGGVGVEYKPFQHFGFRADWELMNKVDTEQTGEFKINIVTFGVTYHF